MKKLLSSKSFLLLTFLEIFLLISSAAFAEIVGSFTRVQGRVDIMRTNSISAVSVHTSDPVAMRDYVRTKSDGKAEILFNDQTTITLAPDTRIKIDEYVYNPDAGRKKGIIGLFRGKLRAVVSHVKGSVIPVSADASSFNVTTPTAVAGVRGTEFIIFYLRGITGILFKEGQGFVYTLTMPDRIVYLNRGQITFVLGSDMPPLPPRDVTDAEFALYFGDTAFDEESGDSFDYEGLVTNFGDYLEGGAIYWYPVYVPVTDVYPELLTITSVPPVLEPSDTIPPGPTEPPPGTSPPNTTPPPDTTSPPDTTPPPDVPPSGDLTPTPVTTITEPPDEIITPSPVHQPSDEPTDLTPTTVTTITPSPDSQPPLIIITPASDETPNHGDEDRNHLSGHHETGDDKTEHGKEK